MNKVVKWSIAAILTGAFLFCSFTAVAVLDELVRLPFFYTLPVLTLFINAISLFLLLRKRSRNRSASNAFAKSISRMASPFRDFALGSNGLKQSLVTPSSVAGINISKRDYLHSSQEMKAALKTIHSIIWGFPTQKRVIVSIKQEEQGNDKTHQ